MLTEIKILLMTKSFENITNFITGFSFEYR